jgi:hypothetical protein
VRGQIAEVGRLEVRGQIAEVGRLEVRGQIAEVKIYRAKASPILEFLTSAI